MLLEHGGSPLDDLHEELLLAVDVAVERGAQQAQLVPEVAHRRPVETAAGKQAPGRLDDVFSTAGAHRTVLTGWEQTNDRSFEAR